MESYPFFKWLLLVKYKNPFVASPITYINFFPREDITKDLKDYLYLYMDNPIVFIETDVYVYNKLQITLGEKSFEITSNYDYNPTI